MTYEIWFDNYSPIRGDTKDKLTFSSKNAAREWILKNIDESRLRRRYKIREAL
jgi:hypothetical protein